MHPNGNSIDKESSISLSVAANTPVKRTVLYLLEGKVESTDYADASAVRAGR
jgi:hypothetical protein